jgi:hypothetical protein
LLIAKFNRKWIQHVSNPLHIYCRLIDFGLSAGVSKRLGIFYEKYLYSNMSKDLGVKWNLPKKRYL